MSNPLLAAALKYMEQGLSVIPVVPGDKKPLIKWEPFQERRAGKLEITSWWSSNPNANIGIVTGPISGIAVVDIDTDEGKEAILQYIPDSIVVPTTKTPKGGNHLYFSYPDNFDVGNNARLITGCDFRGKGGYVVAPPSVNGSGNGYEWVIDFDRSLLMTLPESYIKKISTFKGGDYKGGDVRTGKNSTLQNEQSLHFLQKGQRDNDLFELCSALSRGGYDVELASKIMEIVASNCNPPFPEKDVLEKVKSVYDRTKKKERNIMQEVRDWVSLQDSYIYLTEAYTSLQTLQASEKAAMQVAFHRLCKDGVLEKTGKGAFKKVEPDCSDIDLWSADTTPLKIKYPMGIHEHILTHPKNIIVVAGEPNAGKTAFLLNFAQMNCGRDREVVYFSSEMGAIELQARLRKFNLPMDEWKKIVWKERASDFASVIRPDAINIIDFLEVHDEFYKIGLFIKQIFDKLNNGIAVIALQKNKGRDEGLGGMRSLEKARLYLAMEPGRIKIVKAKNWRNDESNPNGLFREWKLVSGCTFKTEKDTDWKRETATVSGGFQPRQRNRY